MISRAHIEQTSRAAATWYPVDENRIVARVLGGTKLVVDRRDMSLTPHLVIDGFWESWITCWAMSQCRPDDRMLNIGANCGYYSVLFARHMSQVVAVEPQPQLANNIVMSAALNGLSDRLRVMQCVAGSSRRTVRLHQHDSFAGSAFVSDRAPGSPEWSGMDVQEMPAHEMMPDATCAFIDAEGYEPLIWEGLSPLLEKRQLRWIALEWAPLRYESPERFLGKLSEYGTLAVVKDQGQEVPAPPAELLREGIQWDTLVVRRR